MDKGKKLLEGIRSDALTEQQAKELLEGLGIRVLDTDKMDEVLREIKEGIRPY